MKFILKSKVCLERLRRLTLLALIYVGSAVKLARPMATTMRMKLNLSIFVHMELYLHHMRISETEEEEQHWVTPNELLAASSDEFHTQYTYSSFSMLCFPQHSSTPPLFAFSLFLFLSLHANAPLVGLFVFISKETSRILKPKTVLSS